MERLQKRLARCGVASRRKAEEIIKEGRVKVNNEVITSMGFIVSDKDEVKVDDVILTAEVKKYYLMYKPRYLISAVSDGLGRPTVISVLPSHLKKERLFPVGRLDYDTKGVLLLTNDGDFANAVLGPKSRLEKEYLVRVTGLVSPETLRPLTTGLVYKGEMYLPAKYKIESLDQVNNSSSVRLIITEGKYHQVKRMFEAIDFPVKRLTRVRFGNIKLDQMSEGEIRELTIHEVKVLINLAINSYQEEYERILK